MVEPGGHTAAARRAARERDAAAPLPRATATRSARDQLAEEMLPLARALAGRYAGRGEPLDDLVQVACIGIMKAIDGFDLTREVRFSSYATPTVLGEIKRHFRDKTWAMRVPRGMQELQLQDRPGARQADQRARPLADRRRSSPRRSRRRSRRCSQTIQSARSAPHALARRAGRRGHRRSPTRSAARDPELGRAEIRVLLDDALRRPLRARPRGPAPALRGGPHADRDLQAASGSRRCRSRG